MLIPEKLSLDMQDFIRRMNATPVQNQDAAIKAYCDQLERVIYDAIRSITITIPPGTINVVAPPPSGVGVNVSPTILELQVK